uniref:Uncharacterized protein n=1 Tax=Zea mays TaxID=4577 RepID=C4J2P3_MAIZE|nr:unknown [Zea mays]
MREIAWHSYFLTPSAAQHMIR